MNKIYLLLVCCFISLAASAVTVYPISMTTPYGGATQTICQNRPNVATTIFYSVCGTSTAGSLLTATPTWYLNGAVVYTGAPITIAAAGGSFTLPAAAFTYTATGTFSGALGLYCQLDWVGASPCGGVTSIVSAPTTVNVSVTPSAITGTASVCTGQTTTLNATPASGVWTSNAPLVAGIASISGVATGNAAGTAVITYTLGSGCYSTQVLTINQTPAAITGLINVCTNTINTMHDATLGGVWSSSNPTVATIGSATGTMSDFTPGITTISYTLSTGCQSTISVTVNQSPSIITGTMAICAGTQTTLTDTITGGDWTSSTPGVASVVFNTGVVTGVAAGTARITYTLSSGCNTTAVVTVNPLPAAISGVASVCVNSLTILTDATTGGFWSSSNSSVVNIGTGSAFAASGASAGLDTIYYTLSATGCQRSIVVTVNPLPAPISGTLSVCAGLTTALTDLTSGGTWSSGTTTIATIVSSTGLATGVAAGTSMITYKLGTGCLITAPITVNPLPANISGATAVCVGSGIVLSDASAGGTWSSNNPIVATIVSGTGAVTGMSPGTAMITYTLGTGCFKTFVITVNSVPVGISGPTNVCVSSSITLSDATTGGTWISSTPTVATVTSTGVVAGVSAGTTTITYRLTATGCLVTYVVTVNPLPLAITGIGRMCAGQGTSLTDATIGGTWSSTNVGVATIDASGNVSGIAAGTSLISYVLGTGCKTTSVVTVNPLPLAISGLSTVCTGLTITVSDLTAGGTWSVTNPSVATISVSGVITGGFTAGADTVIYTLSTGCNTTKTITVNPLPSAITGTTFVCVGLTTQLTDATTGGLWTSSNTLRATVDGTGLVTGVGAGTVTITYALATSCQKTIIVTVNPLPAAITGTTFVCEGSTTNLLDGTSSGGWTSLNTGVATIAPSGVGVVTGVSAGTAIISYTLSTGCASSTIVTVNPLPAPISGIKSVCVGLTTNLTDATSGGLWTSSSASVASVGLSTGLVNGVAAGTANITYTLATNCKVWTAVTVNPLPAVITGATSVCIGFSVTLNDITSGGGWTSSNPGVATITPGSGVVVGVSSGTATMTYTLPTGCIRTTNVIVHSLPSTILGPGNVCQGMTVTLSDPDAGGTWTSSSTAIATAGAATGVITGVNAGTVNITYTLSTGCYTTSNMVVNPAPPAITGVLFVCVGRTTTLSDGLFVGTWSSANPAVATIDAGGVVTGVAAGTAIISYTSSVGCFKTATITVHPLPSAIMGNLSVCAGVTSSLADATPLGSWSSSNPGVAGVSGGLVTPVAAGTTTISYTLTTGCYTTSTLTVNPVPSSITGINNVCAGASTTLTDATPGGTWTSSNASIASIDSLTGTVSGMIGGTVTITYMLPTGCKQTLGFTVYTIPAPITGVPFLCQALTTTLHDVTPGGVWSSGNTLIATITSSGVVTGVNIGTATISYTGASGCSATTTVTVNPFPTAILGTLTVCTGASTPLSDAVTGGEWTSSNLGRVTIGLLTGVATGVSAGTATITYTMGTGCTSTAVITINQSPAAITGPSTVCAGSVINLTDVSIGGTWSSSNDTVATVGIGTGHVIAQNVPGGTATISYTIGLCSSSKTITVNASPSQIFNTVVPGAFALCTSTTTVLSDSVSGGTWSSSNTSVATVGVSSGIVGAISPGTANISYTLGSGCAAFVTITVNANPGPIMGATNVCPNASITLSDAATGGTWISQDATIASVAAATGVVTGQSAGTVVITYSLGIGCIVTTTINVNTAPLPITGILAMCQGWTVTLSDATPGGVWTSSQPSVAAIGLTTGVVSGILPDTATITYRVLTTGCFATAVVTVNQNPTAITGITNTCVGSTTTLSDAVPFGNWSSADITIAATAGPTGVVTGVDTGLTTITYTLPTGCYTTTLFRVNSVPVAITGISELCEGAIATLSDVTPFGTWSSSNTAVATVNSVSGDLTGVGAGTATITYQLGTGCNSTYEVTINPLPEPIVGPTYVCIGSTIFMSDATPGGTWSSSDPGVATVSGAVGDVTGVSVGITSITYMLGTGCFLSELITVNANPTPVTGDGMICSLYSDTLTSTPLGGVWTSSNTTIAIVDSFTGIVTGQAPGIATITYTSLAGCNATLNVTINPIPSPITGLNHLCPGTSTNLFDATGGGTWSSSDPTVVTITSVGTVTAILASSTAVISYAFVTSGCAATMVFSVDPLPYIGTIGGITTVCEASTTALTDSVAGGTWSSANTGIASVIGSTGVVTGVSAGTTTITYIVNQQCGADTATTSVQVNPLPFAGPILGFTQICANFSATLSDTVLGGIWTSSDPSVATVDSFTGVVFGVSGGMTFITYTYTNSCGSAYVIDSVTVNEAFAFGRLITLPDTPMCSNTLFQNFGALGTPPPGIYYHWSATNAQIFDTSSNGQYALVSFHNPGLAVVRLLALILSSGCAISDSFVTTIGSGVSINPHVQYYLSEFICTDNTADSYQWGYDNIATLDSTIIRGQITQDYYNPSPDTLGRNYWVITTKNGCSQKTYYTYNTITSVGTVAASYDVRLFPNPAESRVNIEVSGVNWSDEVVVKMTDMLGKDIQSAPIMQGKGSFDVSGLPAGVYTVVITRNGMRIGSKMFVKN